MHPGLKNLLKIIAGLLLLCGAVWLLQGLNILPGSFMSGNPRWTVNGGITLIAGAGLFWFANRR